MIPTSSPSEIVPVTLEQPKNSVKVLDVYETKPVVVSLYTTASSPVVPNPTVESTFRIVAPELACPINFVLG